MSFLQTINPGLILIFAGILAACTPVRQVRQTIAVIAPVLAILLLQGSPMGVDLASMNMMGLDMVLYHRDATSNIFGLAFLIAAVLQAIYGWRTASHLEDASALIYSGAAVCAVFVGDLMSLFVFWELTAIASVFLILKTGTRAAYAASMRYLGVQILSGLLLLIGAVKLFSVTGDISLRQLTLGADAGTWFLFFAFGIKAAFPFLHNWLQDSYPKATIVGTVVLSAFTTKLSVYVLLRVFPGENLLIYIGAVMTIFPVFFAVLENDLRKVLAYSLNNQVGFMVCAVGLADVSTIYGQYAYNGAAAHAFAHIMYKSLLFMSMGAVLLRTGTTKASELGGLYKSMPWTTVFCLIGAASISAFPLFSGFVAKSMTMSSAAYQGYYVVWFMLLFASAGVLEHSGIKVPYFAFFAHDSGKRVDEAPFPMLLAMGLSSFLCIFIGLPAIMGPNGGFGWAWLYDLLPYADEAKGYGTKSLFTGEHILTQMQLLVLAMFAFVLLSRIKWYPDEERGTILDTDIVYRKGGYGIATWAGAVWSKAGPALSGFFQRIFSRAYERIYAAFSPQGLAASGPLTGAMAIWAAGLLGVTLLIALFSTA